MKKEFQLDLAYSNRIDQSPFPIDFNDIESFVAKIRAHYKQDISFINYLFTNDQHILEVNKDHLNHNYPTDIITFQYQENPIEADIIISIETVFSNSVEFNEDPTNELYRVIAHGLLHCLGYNDITDEERNIMRNQEDFCLSLHNVSRETNRQ